MTQQMKKITDVFKSTPRNLILEIALGGICLQILALSVPLFLRVIFDKVIVHSSYSTLHVIGTGMIIAALFEAVLLFAFTRHIHFLFVQVAGGLGLPIMKKLMSLPQQFFDEHSKGEIAKYFRDISDIRTFFSAASVSTLIDSLFIVVVLVLMLFYSVSLALIAATSMPIFVILSVLMRPSVTGNQKHQSMCQTKFDTLVTEALTNMQTIKTHAFEPKWIEKWSAVYKNYVHAALKMKLSASFEHALVRMVQRVIMLIVLWVGAAQVVANELSYGQLIVSYMFAQIVMISAGKVFETWLHFQNVLEAKNSLDDLLLKESEQVEAASCTLDRHSGLSIQNVSHRFQKSTGDVLKNVNIEIPIPSFTGIIGQSGSGKSTLVKLLQRHATATKGKIEYGGVDIDLLDIAELRRHILLVMQDAALFHDTILSNLMYGAENTSLEEVMRVSKLMCADDFIQKLPNGYNTVLDERAARISSGQRQRIVLARAILQSPQILVIDEATNALDSETELIVLKNLRNEFSDKILIVITHRPRTLVDADQIIQIVHGHVTRMTQPYSSILSAES
jgi:subfamily B ATP-binding cassette protein HlyB/CyaB